jgi:hypothetical protein
MDLADAAARDVRGGKFTECEALARFADGAVRLNRFNTGTAVAYFEAITPINFSNLFASALNGMGAVNARTDAVTLGGWGRIQWEGDQQRLIDERDNGFNPKFKDEASSEGFGGTNVDQSHHFAAFFQLGYSLGSTLGEWGARLLDPLNDGDANLGRAAAAIGARLRRGEIAPAELGNVIRREICGQ